MALELFWIFLKNSAAVYFFDNVQAGKDGKYQRGHQIECVLVTFIELNFLNFVREADGNGILQNFQSEFCSQKQLAGEIEIVTFIELNSLNCVREADGSEIMEFFKNSRQDSGWNSALKSR